ncbi:MAG: RNA methyltransferase [Betaproteobacteria bacterium]
MQTNFPLDNISIILVDTRTPANIGATARCMMNMGMRRLVLVHPPKDPDNEALKLAAGADQIVKQALLMPTLGEAIAGQHLVIGTSRHPSRLRRNVMSPRETAERVAPLLARNNVAIVFGSEVNGLDNDQLALCHEIISIPSSGAFPSLNLSHAVIVVAYEFFVALRSTVVPTNRHLAPAEDLELFYRHLQETLVTIGFLDRDHPERIMFSLRQIFGRSRLDSREVNILRGIISSIDRISTKNQ